MLLFLLFQEFYRLVAFVLQLLVVGPQLLFDLVSQTFDFKLGFSQLGFAEAFVLHDFGGKKHEILVGGAITFLFKLHLLIVRVFEVDDGPPFLDEIIFICASFCLDQRNIFLLL